MNKDMRVLMLLTLFPFAVAALIFAGVLIYRALH
jgi:hypothetical protein